MLRSAALAAAVACALTVSGCGGSESSTPDAGTAEAPAGTATDDGISLEEAREQPPPPVPHLVGQAAGGGVRLRWPASPDVRYRVLRSEGDGRPEELGIVTVAEPGETTYLDESARAGRTYRYRIGTENLWGLPGPDSPEVSVTAE